MQSLISQIMKVLLDAFNPSLYLRVDGNYDASVPHLVPPLPVTGLRPHAAPLNSKNTAPSSDGVENWISNEQNSKSPLAGKAALKGRDDTERTEVMHFACKGLLTLIKFLAFKHVKVSSC